MGALTKADMVDELTIRLRLTRQQARKLVDGFFEEISQSLAQGHEVKLSGFGNFELKDKNPQGVIQKQAKAFPFRRAVLSHLRQVRSCEAG